MQNTKSRFCILPWVQFCATTEGNALSCCRSMGSQVLGDLKSQSIDEIWNSDNYQSLRNKILNNEYVADCEYCYQLEENGVKSTRQSSNEIFAHFFHLVENNNPQIKDLELRLSNNCNLACKTCGPKFSTSWNKFVDRKEVFITEKNQPFLDDVIAHLSSIESIHFAGGEPLLNDDNVVILENLISNNLTNTALTYVTNLTILNDKQINLWKKFKQINVIISLDGTEERVEYIRSGLIWNQVLTNLQKLKTQLPHITINISFTLSILNIFHLPDFLNKLLRLNIVETIFQVNVNYLHKPNFYSALILNEAERLQLKNQYMEAIKVASSSLDPKNYNYFEKYLNDVLIFLNSGYNLEERKKFFLAIKQVDKLMKSNFVKTFPELKDLYTECGKKFLEHL